VSTVKADLHIHSTFSDSSDTIGQIIDKARNRGLDAIAITDHDTMSHMAQIPTVTDIQVITGVEISAAHRKPQKNTKAHILGYNIQKPGIITALTQPILEARNKTSENQAGILMNAGFFIDMTKLPRADGKYLYKQHIMDWLVATGQAPDMLGEFYQKIFKDGGICDFDIDDHYIDAFEAIKAVKEAGGFAVLAHPGQQQNFWLIPQLVRSGLDGLELNHHTNSQKDKEAILNYANHYRLFLTGGSDYHGKYEPQLLGDFLSAESGVNAICSPVYL